MFHLKNFVLEVAALYDPCLHLVGKLKILVCYLLNLVRHHFNLVRHHFKVLKGEQLRVRLLFKSFLFQKRSSCRGVIVEKFIMFTLYVILNNHLTLLFLRVHWGCLKLPFQIVFKLRAMNHFEHHWKLKDCKKSSYLSESFNYWGWSTVNIVTFEV
jgi:hypothetical protein